MPSTELVRFSALGEEYETMRASPNSKIIGVGGIDFGSRLLEDRSRLFSSFNDDTVVASEYLVHRCGDLGDRGVVSPCLSDRAGEGAFCGASTSLCPRSTNRRLLSRLENRLRPILRSRNVPRTNVRPRDISDMSDGPSLTVLTVPARDSPQTEVSMLVRVVSVSVLPNL